MLVARSDVPSLNARCDWHVAVLPLAMPRRPPTPSRCCRTARIIVSFSVCFSRGHEPISLCVPQHFRTSGTMADDGEWECCVYSLPVRGASTLCAERWLSHWCCLCAYHQANPAVDKDFSSHSLDAMCDSFLYCFSHPLGAHTHLHFTKLSVAAHSSPAPPPPTHSPAIFLPVWPKQSAATKSTPTLVLF